MIRHCLVIDERVLILGHGRKEDCEIELCDEHTELQHLINGLAADQEKNSNADSTTQEALSS
jgi:hypothetical protein